VHAVGRPNADARERDDREVATGILAGRAEALARAYEQHATAVFDFSRCIVRDAGLAEDVVQDVFLRLWRSPDRFDPDRGSLRSYLLTMAYGRSIDVVRSETARHRREAREIRLSVVAPNRDDDALLDRDVVRDALATLHVAEREAIALAYFGGYSYRQVAAVLGVPEGTIKNRIRTGLAHLREELDPAATGPGVRRHEELTT
jgi:RNA polymerase sigma-70 factor (ECF subfamily)